jgi:hypothetical protein
LIVVAAIRRDELDKWLDQEVTMTSNQIQYAAQQEEVRHNQVAEAENERHNKATETLQEQANLIESAKAAADAEYKRRSNDLTAQYNQIYADIQYGTLQLNEETQNRLYEINTEKNEIARLQAEADKQYKEDMALNADLQLQEVERHNKELESNDLYGKQVQDRANKLNFLMGMETQRNERSRILVQEKEAQTHKLQMLNSLRLGIIQGTVDLQRQKLDNLRFQFDIFKYEDSEGFLNFSKSFANIVPW